MEEVKWLNARRTIATGRPSNPFLTTKEAPGDTGVQGCAYEKGFKDGLDRKENLDLGLDDLPVSQAGSVRHRSPHAAYARGYYDGVHKSYEP